MNTAMTALEQAFAAYRDDLTECARKQKPTDGLFGIGHSIKDDACHERLDQRIEQIIREMAESKPASDDAETAARTLFTQNDRYAYPEPAQWMLYAVERHIILLVPFLMPEAAGRLCTEYGKRYRAWERLPVQRNVYAALKKRGKEKA